MTQTLIVGAKVWDATGGPAFVGDVLVDGNRIAAVAKGTGTLAASDAQVIDGAGLFLMPGMTEGHAHLSFEAVASTEDLIATPPEEQVLGTARTAKVLIDHGFTSAYGASAARLRLDVAVRNEVNAGRLPGPRIRAGSIELTVTGGMGDESRLHNIRSSPSISIDGAEEMRKAVRLCIREGCDNIKLVTSGDPFYPQTPATSTPMSFEEVKMAVDTAHALGAKVNAHARSAQSVKNCIRAGVDGIFHAEFVDEEGMDMLEAAKDRVFVMPTVSLFPIMMNEAAAFGFPAEVGVAMGLPAVIEASARVHTEMRKRGIRHLIGGDYGFLWSRQGTNARDLKFFVDLFGYSPEAALVCATRNGGLAMRSEGDLGVLSDGALADMLLVDGDPTQDVTIMTDKDRLVMIMKDGQVHKNETHAVKRRAAA